MTTHCIFRRTFKRTKLLASLAFIGVSLTACLPEAPEHKLGVDEVASLLPKRVSDRQGWASDIVAVFEKLKIPLEPVNVCTAVAIIDQESNFVADPAVPNLGEVSLKALNDKLDDKLGKTLAGYFRTMLDKHPTPDKSFAKRIKAVKTERQLDELFREMFAYFAKTYKVGAVNDTAKLLNNGIDEKLNPITTLGSMQVHIDYAKDHRRANMNNDELRTDLYSRYGGLYYGIHRLMLYQADYDKPLYRFADYNSGMYSSRNASFQEQVGTLANKKLALDGDLLIYKDGKPTQTKGETEKTLIALAPTLALTEAQIRQDLKKEKSQKFETTATYQAVQTAYRQKTKKDPKYAIMPQVVISGVKLSRDYNTNWFATNVNKRYDTCMAAARREKLV